MSKLLKSKILVGVFAFALMFAGVVAVNTANAATCDMGATTLRQGSKSEAVKCLQQTLNAKGFTVATTGAGSMGMETTTFGPATKAAVMSFQASSNLTPVDGVVGAITRGALNAAVVTTPTPTNLPAGCTSTAGFSTTTGQPCSTTTNLPAGCTSTVGFSPTTGAKCDSTTTTPTPSTTNFTVSVNGTQGDIDTVSSGTPDKTEALEGQKSVEVWAADIETEKNGPLMVQTLDVWFGNSDTTSSYKPWDYFTSVDLMVDGKKVASMDVDSASDWTKNESNTSYVTSVSSTNEYRLRFSNLNSVLPSGDTTTVSVAVSVANTIDTADQSAEWEVALGNLRIMDETGFVTTYDYTQSINSQDSFTMGGADVAKLDLSDSTSNPVASVIKVSETANTEGVTVYAFEIEEENDVDATIEEMTFLFTTSATSTNSVYARAFLYQGSNLVGTETVGGSNSTSSVTFDNMNISLNGDSTSQFTVKVDLKDNNSGARYPEGTTITVSATAITAAEDVNGNDEGDMALSYSGTSKTHELRSQGINVVRVGTPTATKTTSTDTATTADSAEFVVKFNVTAFGANMYVDMSTVDNGTTTAGQGVSYNILKNGTVVSATGSTYSTASAILEAAGSTTNDTGDAYRVDQNATREFTLRVSFPLSVSPTGTDSDGFYQMLVESINWDNESTDTTPDFFYTFNLDDFKTPNISLSDYSI